LDLEGQFIALSKTNANTNATSLLAFDSPPRGCIGFGVTIAVMIKIIENYSEDEKKKDSKAHRLS
jgi:hypothetical protein